MLAAAPGEGSGEWVYLCDYCGSEYTDATKCDHMWVTSGMAPTCCARCGIPSTPPAAQSAEDRVKVLEAVIRPHIEDLEASAKVADENNRPQLAKEFLKAAAEFKAALETK